MEKSLERVEIPIAMPQRMAVTETEAGDQTVDGLSDAINASRRAFTPREP
jgi:hypothetical protein